MHTLRENDKNLFLLLIFTTHGEIEIKAHANSDENPRIKIQLVTID